MTTPTLHRGGDLLPVLLRTYVPAVAVLALLVVAAVLADVPVEQLTRDPIATAEVSALTGVASNLGALAWMAGATTCLFTALVIARDGARTELRRFLVWAGLLTALLCADDLFLLHESIGAALDVSERVILSGYAVLLIGGLWRFRDVLATTDLPLLAAALALFATSLAVDVVQESLEALLGPGRILLEDGSKILGAVGWLGYFGRTCLVALAPADRHAGDDDRALRPAGDVLR